MSPNIRPSWYERHVLPYLIDIACGIRPVWHQRHKVVPLAEGCILEIGIGTGLNFEHYNKANIEKIVGLDPGLAMYRLARKRVKQASLAVELVGLSAEKIPYQEGSFDTVLVTYSLCTIPNPGGTQRNASGAQAGREAYLLQTRAGTRCVSSPLAGSTHAALGETGGRMST